MGPPAAARLVMEPGPRLCKGAQRVLVVGICVVLRVGAIIKIKKAPQWPTPEQLWAFLVELRGGPQTAHATTNLAKIRPWP